VLRSCSQEGAFEPDGGLLYPCITAQVVYPAATRQKCITTDVGSRKKWMLCSIILHRIL
jgi:hypothetical protein